MLVQKLLVGFFVLKYFLFVLAGNSLKCNGRRFLFPYKFFTNIFFLLRNRFNIAIVEAVGEDALPVINGGYVYLLGGFEVESLELDVADEEVAASHVLEPPAGRKAPKFEESADYLLLLHS